MISAFSTALSLPRRAATNGRPRSAACGARMGVLKSADAMTFFSHREGRWHSRRVTHHLAFKNSESGESEIEMAVLPSTDERIVQLCKDHGVDPLAASGGCHVTWKATMAWDQEGENHEGATVFALVPDEGTVRAGRILRDRGYAEIVPIAGRYALTDDDDLYLETPYEGGAVEETFSFDSENVCNRTSTVRRFGGLATATFSTETRLGGPSIADIIGDVDDAQRELEDVFENHLFFGVSPSKGKQRPKLGSDFLQSSRERFQNIANQAKERTGPPSTNSAFGEGFSSSREPSTNSAFGKGQSPSVKEKVSEARVENVVEVAARKAGIDLSKVPPSMRAEFLASLEKDSAALKD